MLIPICNRFAILLLRLGYAKKLFKLQIVEFDEDKMAAFKLQTCQGFGSQGREQSCSADGLALPFQVLHNLGLEDLFVVKDIQGLEACLKVRSFTEESDVTKVNQNTFCTYVSHVIRVERAYLIPGTFLLDILQKCIKLIVHT